MLKGFFNLDAATNLIWFVFSGQGLIVSFFLFIFAQHLSNFFWGIIVIYKEYINV